MTLTTLGHRASEVYLKSVFGKSGQEFLEQNHTDRISSRTLGFVVVIHLEMCFCTFGAVPMVV